MNNDWIKSREVWDLLIEAFSLPLPAFHVEPLNQYRSLLQEWNPTTKLMSAEDVRNAVDDHVADAWSLLPYCWSESASTLLDVGSGGGFPGVPLALASRQLSVTLTERSVKKAAFLSRVSTRLNLTNLSVVAGSFPEAVGFRRFDYLTAHAVERPGTLRDAFAQLVVGGTTFLCQSEYAMPDKQNIAIQPIRDLFTERGHRRGRLWLVSRRQ